MSSQSARQRVPSVVLFIALFLALSTTALYAAASGAVSDSQPAAAQPARPAPLALPQLTQPLVLRPAVTAHRPAALVPLYISFAALEALDAHSTIAGLGNGAQEANPAMSGLA